MAQVKKKPCVFFKFEKTQKREIVNGITLKTYEKNIIECSKYNLSINLKKEKNVYHKFKALDTPEKEITWLVSHLSCATLLVHDLSSPLRFACISCLSSAFS